MCSGAFSLHTREWLLVPLAKYSWKKMLIENPLVPCLWTLLLRTFHWHRRLFPGHKQVWSSLCIPTSYSDQYRSHSDEVTLELLYTVTTCASRRSSHSFLPQPVPSHSTVLGRFYQVINVDVKVVIGLDEIDRELGFNLVNDHASLFGAVEFLDCLATRLSFYCFLKRLDLETRLTQVPVLVFADSWRI